MDDRKTTELDPATLPLARADQLAVVQGVHSRRAPISAVGAWQQVGADVPTTSGTSWLLPVIPADFNDLMVEFVGVSHNSGANQLFQAAYSDNGTNFTSAFTVSASVAASAVLRGDITIFGYRRPEFVAAGRIGATTGVRTTGAATVTNLVVQLGAPLTQVRITVNGGAGDAGLLRLLVR